ncbi:MAG: AIR synthase-related protein, partial [Burkholderiaceae bacterium]
PRVALGLALRGIAHAAIDVSDGLLGDLGHVLKASGVGACIQTGALDRLMACSSPDLSAQVPPQHQLACILAGGDDYELAFTAAPEHRAAVTAAARTSATPVTRIGQIEAQPGLRVVDSQGQPVSGDWQSFDHFAAQPGAGD